MEEEKQAMGMYVREDGMCEGDRIASRSRRRC